MFVSIYCTDKEVLTGLKEHLKTSGLIYPTNKGVLMLQGDISAPSDIPTCSVGYDEDTAIYVARRLPGLPTAVLLRKENQ